MKRKIQVLIVLLIVGSGSLYAQKKDSGNIKHGASKSKMIAQMDDKQFAREAAKGGMSEIDMGNDAKDKAGSERVKNFGAMMVRDHTKATEELKSIMNKENITWPDKTTMNPMLQDKTGTSYDKQYMKMMVEDHVKDISLFERESRTGKDAELKAYAYRMLPTLKMHLDSARAVQSSLKGVQSSSK
jgi:putative membrane protein